MQPITEINEESIRLINKAYKMTTEQIVNYFRTEAKKSRTKIGRKKVEKIQNAYNWIKDGYNKAVELYNKRRKPVPKFKQLPKFEGRKIILEEPEGPVLKPVEEMKGQELTTELNLRGIKAYHPDRPMKTSEARRLLRQARGEPEPPYYAERELMGKEDVRIVEKGKVPASEIYTKFLFLQDLPFLPRKDNDEYKEGKLIKENPVTIYPEKLLPFLEFIVNHYSSSLRLNRKNFEMWNGESWFSAEFPKFIMELIGNYEDMSKSLLPENKKKQFKLLYLDWFKALSQAEKIKFLDEIMKSVRRTNYEKAPVDKLGPYSRHLLGELEVKAEPKPQAEKPQAEKPQAEKPQEESKSQEEPKLSKLEEIKRLGQKEKNLLREVLIKTLDYLTRNIFEGLIYKFTLDEMKKFKKEYDLSKIYSIIKKLTEMDITFWAALKNVTILCQFKRTKNKRETLTKTIEQIKTYLANTDLWENFEPRLQAEEPQEPKKKEPKGPSPSEEMEMMGQEDRASQEKKLIKHLLKEYREFILHAYKHQHSENRNDLMRRNIHSTFYSPRIPRSYESWEYLEDIIPKIRKIYDDAGLNVKVILKSMPSQRYRLYEFELLSEISSLEELTQKFDKTLTASIQEIQTLKELQTIQDFFYGTKKVKLDQKLTDIILNLHRNADFFPTPPDVSEYIYKRVLDAYGSDPIYVLDMCAGLASLSLPFIENIRPKDKVYLEELSVDFYNFIKPLQTSQIKVNIGNSLNETWTSGKGINTIVCNPPFSISFEHKGKMYTDFKQGYLFFLYKACKILSELTIRGELYFICPTTYFKDGEFKIPKKTKKMIEEYFNDTLEDDEDWYYQVELVKEITNFKTFDKYGKPKPFKATFGLFHIIPLISQYK